MSIISNMSNNKEYVLTIERMMIHLNINLNVSLLSKSLLLYVNYCNNPTNCLRSETDSKLISHHIGHLKKTLV